MDNTTVLDLLVQVHVTEDTNLTTDPTEGMETLTVLQIVISCCLSGVTSVLGIVANAVCITVFVRQEFKESTNITLLALAISDFCCCLTMFWMSLVQTAYILDPPPFLFDLLSLLAMTGSFPRIIITRVTSWLTALIALERCVCVALPFKVKAIFSPKHSAVMTAGVFSIMFSANMLLYYSNEFAMTYNPRFNLSQFTMKTIPERVDVAFYINAFVLLLLPLVNYAFIMSCTLVMVIQLKIATKWRNGACAGVKDGPITHRVKEDHVDKNVASRLNVESPNGDHRIHLTKETRLTKLIATTTSVHVVCHAPSNAALIISCFVPEFSFNGRYSLAYLTLCILGFLLETVNSSIPLFVYYGQSSKFKAEILRRFSGGHFRMLREGPSKRACC